VSCRHIYIAENKFISLKEGINMRVYFTFSRAALVLAVVCMAMGMPAGAYAMESASVSQQVVVAEPTTPANLLNFTEYFETADAKTPAAKEAAPATDGNCNQGCGGCACECYCEPCRYWYIEPEIQQMFGYTSFQFGGSSPLTGPYTPISKLDYSLDSTWTGLRVGVQRCNWDIHFEWLTPMVRSIDRGMKDYDWNIDDPRNDPTRLDSLSHSKTRWNDGQKLELEADYKYSDCILGMPVEVWPLAGFRFQRFGITAYGAEQLIPPDGPFAFQGDVLTINQQYYMGYIGFQLRRTIERECRAPINLAFQFDWGGTAGYMVDHHLIRTDIPGFSTVENTGGDTVHVALRGDIPLNCHWNLGLQADYYRIRTTGTITQLSNGVPFYAGDYGVLVKSEQTDITAYLLYTF
jgi:hypothetical protein